MTTRRCVYDVEISRFGSAVVRPDGAAGFSLLLVQPQWGATVTHVTVDDEPLLTGPFVNELHTEGLLPVLPAGAALRVRAHGGEPPTTVRLMVREYDHP